MKRKMETNLMIEYIRQPISNDTNIQRTSKIIGKLENKGIGKLINDVGITDILAKYLSIKERDIYYKSKFKLKELLNKV